MIDRDCQNCIHCEYQDKLTCCALRELTIALYELKKNIPLFKKYAALKRCRWYIKKSES